MKPFPIGVIVTTYNRPVALRAVLSSLRDQHHPPAEVVVADDGSGEATNAVVDEAARSAAFPIQHVWQEDRGFRAAAARNRGIAAAGSDYIVLMDGDCLARPDFLVGHARLAERGFFVRGNRVSLSQRLTERTCRDALPVHRWSRGRWLSARIRGDIDRFFPLLPLPLGPMRKAARRSWIGVKTCNLGAFREDLLAVNGLDEEYVGWGFEDYDLAMRLMKHGVFRKEGRFAVPVLHLWHAETSRADDAKNRQRFERQLALESSRAVKGVDQYL